MGPHAQDFDKTYGIGLGLVLAGLIIYRFLGSRQTAVKAQTTRPLLEGIQDDDDDDEALVYA
jgi:hypothetical protein